MRFSSKDREAHVARWRASGLSKARYCRKAGVPYGSFVVWARSDQVSAEEAPSFVQLSDDRPGPAVSRGGLSVRAKGMSLAFTCEADPLWVARVLTGLASC